MENFTLYLLPSQLHVDLAYLFKIQRLVHQEMSKWSISCQRLSNLYEVGGGAEKIYVYWEYSWLCFATLQPTYWQPAFYLPWQELYNYSLEVLA